MLRFIRSLSRDERGVSALEYAVLAGIIIAAVVAGLKTFSGDIKTAFTNVGQKVVSETK